MPQEQNRFQYSAIKPSHRQALQLYNYMIKLIQNRKKNKKLSQPQHWNTKCSQIPRSVGTGDLCTTTEWLNEKVRDVDICVDVKSVKRTRQPASRRKTAAARGTPAKTGLTHSLSPRSYQILLTTKGDLKRRFMLTLKRRKGANISTLRTLVPSILMLQRCFPSPPPPLPFEFELLRTQPCSFALYQWRRREGWLTG